MNVDLDPSALLALLDDRETVLFPNTSAAQGLRTRFDLEQRARGVPAWQSPRILSWQQWTESLWSQVLLEGADDRILLNPLQEEAIWQEVLRLSEEGRELDTGSLGQLARLSRTALQLAAAHLPLSDMDRIQRSADTEDARAFAAWLNCFFQRCREEGFLSLSALDAALTEHGRGGRLALPPSLHLVGFEQFTPAQTRFLEGCRGAGTSVQVHRLVHPASSVAHRTSVTASDPGEEVRWALRWIRRHFEQHRDAPSGASPRIALILPDPADERGELETCLREILAPELEKVNTDLSSTPWHFSAGAALATAPLIRDALVLLRSLRAELPMEEAASLVLSHSFGHTDSYEARFRFEMHLLRRAGRLRPELTLTELLQLARTSQARDGTAVSLPEFEAVHRLSGGAGVLTGSGSHADWAELVRKLLRSAGWPGHRTLTAEEFHCTEAWDAVLDLLATLDFLPRRLTFSEFLQELEQQVARTQAPGALNSAPVEILNLAGAEASTFDAALVLRATDAQLPAPERLHPLLGAGLQRALGLPGTDPALTHARVRDRLRSLGERCGELLLVCAAANENGLLRPSPLAATLGFATAAAGDLLPEVSAARPVVLERVAERQADLPLPSLDVRGGARMLELQAACGFRAFAALRLEASAPESRTLGMDARERGTALHAALENFWTEVKSQAALKAMNPEERRSAVQRSVRSALRKNRARPLSGEGWDEAYLDITELRFSAILDRWLDFELERGDFTVLPPETNHQVRVGPFEMDIRPDRIDQVAGGFVLVDYKTSSEVRTDHWLGDRPHAPQLPLYTLLGEPEEVRGLAFAKIRPGKDMRWIGLQKEEGDVLHHRSTRVHDLEHQVGLWREELDRLAHDFADGVTDIDPKSYPNTCRFCDHRLLCRLDTATLLAGGDEETAHMAGEDADG